MEDEAHSVSQGDTCVAGVGPGPEQGGEASHGRSGVAATRRQTDSPPDEPEEAVDAVKQATAAHGGIVDASSPREPPAGVTHGTVKKETAAERLTMPTSLRMLRKLEQTQVRILGTAWRMKAE